MCMRIALLFFLRWLKGGDLLVAEGVLDEPLKLGGASR